MEQEQDDNFISRLHGGKSDIIPWPVIESRGFYKLFATLKKRLDQQKISHSTTGEFLHTIKTLMAKLKVCSFFLISFLRRFQANDWGTLSRTLHHFLIYIFSLHSIETMAEHRSRSLSALLPIPLATGYSEIEPDLEPLKVTYRSNRVMRDLMYPPRTLTLTLQWRAMTLRPALLSLTMSKFPRPRSRGILRPYLNIGLPVLHVNPYQTPTGLRDSHRISKGWLTYVSITSGFG